LAQPEHCSSQDACTRFRPRPSAENAFNRVLVIVTSLISAVILAFRESGGQGRFGRAVTQSCYSQRLLSGL